MNGVPKGRRTVQPSTLTISTSASVTVSPFTSHAAIDEAAATALL